MLRTTIFGVCLGVVCLSALPGGQADAARHNQPTAKIAQRTGASSSDSDTNNTPYKIQPGDVLHLQVLNPDWAYLSTDLGVQPDGRVTLPTKPSAVVMAAGETLNQFQAAAERGLGRMIRDPAIIVTMKVVTIPNVFLLGAFAKDGPYQLLGPMRILDVAAKAGGAPEGDLSQVMLTRHGLTRTLNLERAMQTGDSADNVLLQPGDIIVVPVMRKHITVEGQVTKPTNLEYKQNMGIQEAVAAAGGVLDDGDATQVTVAHADGTQGTVNLVKIMDGSAENIKLRPNDVITVPQSRHVLVQGQVTTPKDLFYRPNMTVEEAIAAAEGPKERANESLVSIAHKDGTQTIVDVSKEVRDGLAPTRLLPDDVVTVPEQQDVTVTGQVATPKSILFKPGMTLTQAITAAGGATDRADESNVSISSRDGGQSQTVDYYTLANSGQADTHLIHPGDTITVPEQLARITIVGAGVSHPQTIQYRPGISLEQAIALAGGETATGDLGHVQLTRTQPDGSIQTQTVDIFALRQSGKTSGITLRPGDIITISEQTDRVSVVGSVNHPGEIMYRRGMRVLEALSGTNTATGLQGGAGGPTEKANLYVAKLQHADGKVDEIDLDSVLTGDDPSQNVVLQPNDTLIVPESKDMIYVYGAVLRPGAYYLRENDKKTVLDALNMAGGVTPTAQISKARIAEAEPGHKVGTREVKLDQILAKGDMTTNYEMKPRQVLYVPERNQGNSAAAGILSTLIFLIIPRL